MSEGRDDEAGRDVVIVLHLEGIRLGFKRGLRVYAKPRLLRVPVAVWSSRPMRRFFRYRGANRENRIG
jgi:hypothetical protein